ncbi:siderochrome-iron transporter MirB [Lophiotrema nucula]|uniref:Siderochrome-iron transporter MirB n=1 Tax=Lophiotrema nucula TaxID=690887 RepID=A0A6A5ZEJ8_9PLEO|nr:siderochrome-iron transporter MirB [Lophiotrema nucula]
MATPIDNVPRAPLGDEKIDEKVDVADERELDEEKAHEDGYKQEGVRGVEAITSVWTTKTLWITFALFYLVQFTDSLLQNSQSSLEPYVTSSFSQHGLLSTTSVMSSIISGVSNLTIAKIIDIWGRVEGLIVMVFLLVLGMLMKAVCQNVTTYAAAAVFYWVGHIGLGYVISVFVADMTSLRNRAIIQGLLATPTLGTVFAGPKIAEAFLLHSSFRWAFGAFCIILPVVCLPVIAVFWFNHKKAKQFGVAPVEPSGRTWTQSVKHYVIEFDVLGMLLTTAGFSLVLLPLSLASSSEDKWKSGSIIAMLVVGVICLIAFVIWEKYFAPIQYLPFKYLKDRTILGACLAYFTMFASIYTWDIYLTSYLQVVNEVSISDAGYILNSYSLTSSVIMPLTGVAIRYLGRPKWIALAAVPFATLGTALLIHFRRPGVNVGYITMCQIFNGVSGGMIASAMPISIMAAVSHQEVAVVLALNSMFANIGVGVGLAISGGIWTNLLPVKLATYLPPELKDQAGTIYGDIVTQLSYEWGSPAREAIVQSYGEVQRLMVIAGACFMPLLFLAILVWRDYNVKTIKQTRGNVF